MYIHVESVPTNAIIIPGIVDVSKLTTFMLFFTRLNRQSVLSEQLMLKATVDLSEFGTNKEAKNHRCNVSILNCSAKMAFHCILPFIK